jgi:hypothetical protein
MRKAQGAALLGRATVRELVASAAALPGSL